MDSERFDTLTRTLSSRRVALTGLVGGVATLLGLSGMQEASAHNPAVACRKIADPTRRQACLRRAKRHKRLKHSCKAQPASVTCANRCGSVRNNCGKVLSCTCPPGKSCLGTGDCNRTCFSDGTTQESCPAGCNCLTRNVDDGSAQCVSGTVTACAQLPLGCASTSNCPAGHFCGITACGPNNQTENRCIPICPL